MATTNTTLYKIELPSLSSNSFGSDLRQAFENIDSNFQKLSTLGLTTGEDGAPSLWVPFNLNCVFCSLVDDDFKKGNSGFSDEHMDAINKSFEKYNAITSLDKESYQKTCKELYEQLLSDLPDDNHPVSAVNTYKHKWELDFQPFKNDGLLLRSYEYYIPFTPGDLLVAMNLEKDVNGNKSFNIVGSTSHIYIDPRFRNQYSIEGNANTDDLSQATDQSCVVYIKPCQTDTDHPYGFTFEYVHAFPRIYCAEDGQFYLTINGIDTNIPLTGKTGSAGKDGNIVAVMMDESESENIDGIVYEGISKVTKIDRYIDGENGTSISDPQSLDKCPAFIFPPSGYGSYGTFYWVGYLNWDGDELTAYCGRENLITTDMYEHTFGGMMMGLDMYEKSKARPAGNSPWYKPRGLMLPIGNRKFTDYWDPRDDSGSIPKTSQFGSHIIYSKKPEGSDLKTELHIGTVDDYRRIGQPDDINNNTDYPNAVQEHPVENSELIVDENVTAHKFTRKDDAAGQILLGTGDSTVKITKNGEGTITKSPLRFINSTIDGVYSHADLKGNNDREYYFEADLQAILPLEAGYYYSAVKLTTTNINQRGAYIGLMLNGAKADNPTDHRYIYYMNSRTSNPALIDEYIIPKTGYMYFLSTEQSELGSSDKSWLAPAGKIAVYVTNTSNDTPDDSDWPAVIEDYAQIDAMEQIVEVKDSEDHKKSMSIFPYNFQRRVNKGDIPSSIKDGYSYDTDTGPVNLTGKSGNYAEDCTDVINVCDFTGYTHGYLIKQEEDDTYKTYKGVVDFKNAEGNGRVYWSCAKINANKLVVYKPAGTDIQAGQKKTVTAIIDSVSGNIYSVTCSDAANNAKVTEYPYKLNEMFRFWLSIPKKIKYNWCNYDDYKDNPNYAIAVAKFNDIKNKYSYLWIVPTKNEDTSLIDSTNAETPFTITDEGLKFKYWKNPKKMEGASSEPVHNNLNIRPSINTHDCNRAIKLPKGWINPYKNCTIESNKITWVPTLDVDYYFTIGWVKKDNSATGMSFSCDIVNTTTEDSTKSIWCSQPCGDWSTLDMFNFYMSYVFGCIVQDTNNGTPIIASYKPDLGWNTSWRDISIKNARNALVFNLDNQASQTNFDHDVPYVSSGLYTDDNGKHSTYDGSEVCWLTGDNAVFEIRGQNLITFGSMNLKIGSFVWDWLDDDGLRDVSNLIWDSKTRIKLHDFFINVVANNIGMDNGKYKVLADSGWCDKKNWTAIEDSNGNVTDYFLPFSEEQRKVYHTYRWSSRTKNGRLMSSDTIFPRVSLLAADKIRYIQHKLYDNNADWTKKQQIEDMETSSNTPAAPTNENEGGSSSSDPNASTEPVNGNKGEVNTEPNTPTEPFEP